MKVLITGATGLLGGHLIKELQQRNEEIRALVLPVENADNLLKQGIERRSSSRETTGTA